MLDVIFIVCLVLFVASLVFAVINIAKIIKLKKEMRKNASKEQRCCAEHLSSLDKH